MSFTIRSLMATALVFGAFLGNAFAQDAAPSAGYSLSSQASAKDAVTSQDQQDPANADTYWSTEGSGYCATGNFYCSSGRQIGCNATGDYVKCEYTTGNVGWVRCQGQSNGTKTVFEDRCP